MFSFTVTLLGPQNRVLVSFSPAQCMLLHVLHVLHARVLSVLLQEVFIDFFYVHSTSPVPVTD